VRVRARRSAAAVFRTERSGDGVTVEAEAPAAHGWRVLLVGVREAGTADPAAEVTGTDRGVLVSVPAGTARVSLRLT
jgi:alpha-D-xyloside xylohydrolase